jgi:hypothetical protein
MFTKATRVFNKSAAARIMGVAVSQVIRVQEFINCVLVVGRKFCRFVSKMAFMRDYAKLRQENAKTVAVTLQVPVKAGLVVTDCESRPEANKPHSTHVVSLNTVSKNYYCTCEDFERSPELGMIKPPCKHVYATLTTLGYSSLRDFLKG